MSNPTFFITTGSTRYLQGQATDHFKDLGVDSAQLESYDHEGDYVVLSFTEGLQLSIPERRIQHIGELPAETFETIRYTADIVTIADGHVLLIERGWNPHKGSWALPGGHVDAGETSLAAATRELSEETGITVSTAALRQIGTFDAPNRDPRPARYVTVAYLVTLPETIQPQAGDDATAARWWPLNALPPLAFDHADIITAATHT